MAWIPINKYFSGNPKILRLSQLTKLPKVHIIGDAYCLWDYGDTHADEQGRLYWHTIDDIAAVVGSKEIAKAFCAEEVGWMQVHEDHILLPEWGKYNSKSAKQRLLHNRNVARSRNARMVIGQQSVGGQGGQGRRPPKPTEYI